MNVEGKQCEDFIYSVNGSAVLVKDGSSVKEFSLGLILNIVSEEG